MKLKLPTLYKLTSTGAINWWEIVVFNNKITTYWGQVGGKTQEATDVIEKGKNIGRANETTPRQQAKAEATSAWEKKLKKDYVKTIEEAKAGGSSDLIEGGVLPMLAHRYDKHASKITFPCYAQNKLDGHRCIAVVDGKGKCTLWSRTRKPIKSMPHIVKAIEDLGLTDRIFDGELYNHDYRDKFEEITSLIRPEYAKPNHTEVEYHIYDAAEEGTFDERIGRMPQLPGDGYLVPVIPWYINGEADVQRWFKDSVLFGYEGLILRNIDGQYKHGRSYDLQKVKEMMDSEFEITGVKEGRGKLKGHGIFECRTASGTPFDVKMAGELEGLKEYFDHPDQYIGKMLTVQYQGLTGAAGVPRFPVGLRFREDL